MMFTFQVCTALMALLATTSAHITISKPAPWKGSITSPLGSGGGDFPCQAGVATQSGSTVNTIAAGSQQTMTFSGSAVHGGGSCQISITTDKVPSANSVFKVIQSMEGGCPLHSFPYTIPTDVPNGQVTLAWSWFPNQSGGPEFYMNCATVEVTGGASDTSKFDALPDMFVANIDSTTCEADPNLTGSINVQFPDPGNTVIKASGETLTPPTGDCGSSSGGSGSGGSSAAPISSAPAASTPADAASTPAAGASTPVAQSSPGVFAPGASSAPAASGVPTSFTTVIATTTAALPSTPAASTPAPSSGSSSGSTSCSTDGQIICNGSSQFGICNHGSVVWQDVAPGTTCSSGVVSRRGVNVPSRGRVQRPRRNAPV